MFTSVALPTMFVPLLSLVTFQALPVLTAYKSTHQNNNVLETSSLDIQPRDDDGREVWITSSTSADWSQVSLQKDADGFYGKLSLVHSWLFIQGNDVDGPLRVEINTDKVVLKTGAPMEDIYHIRVLDLRTDNKDKVERNEGAQRTFLQGKTKLTNKDFLNPDTGKGIVARAWGKAPDYKAGMQYQNDYDDDWKLEKKNLNTCNDMLERIMQEMPEKLPLSEKVATIFDISHMASGMDPGRNLKFNLQKLYLEKAAGNVADNTRTIWNMDHASENHELVTFH